MIIDSSIKEYGNLHKKEYSMLRSAIRRYQRIVVFRHIKPDYDAMGSQMGLVSFLKDNFPEKEIHFVGDNHVTFTPRLFPETERLNDEWFNSPFLAIVVDVGDDERIADPRYKRASYIAKIDHHPFKKEIARHPILDLDAAAASEVVTDFLVNWKGTTISKEAAHYLYIALVGDSGRFLYSSTTTHTFACAQALLATGISISDIYLSMYQKKLDDLKVTAYILNHFTVSPHGVAYYVLPEDVQKDLQITSERGKENVNLFSNIEGVNAWCSITEDPNPKDWCWRISIRSKKADISPVAFKWGGGGHAQASGAKIKDLSELDAFIADLDKLFE
ncbi:MAG: bifunctional oligoribonuclease/PAP phosphatase NrnA [Bacilli bacterium]|jgi:phosphoesterase RecJ-like protein|nr:bifunctional oligoribonuclease/PAP phosphatase NrnA [Bacilli bacterium]MCH4210247.1 bifunctional oligoribonuclease/PAP phosphatase NrnA [Bacilli bacterium]